MKKLVVCLWAMACGMAAWADGTIDIASPRSGTGWTVESGVVTIAKNGSYTITGSSDRNRIVIAAGVTATITLQNASITSAVASPFELSASGCTVTLRIEGADTLTATMGNGSTPGFVYAAALQVEGNASVIIDGSGTLTAQGGFGAAGIGSGYIEGDNGHITGAITISGGNLTTGGGTYGAGIGGGYAATSGNIHIAGGAITTTGGEHGAGIGNGYGGDNTGVINITGGSISTTGGYGSAGIGGGNTGVINITGGNISTTGGYGGAGIGGGAWNSGGAVNITGGSVTATGGDGSAGIGGGAQGDGGSISISGGVVLAISGIEITGEGGAGIGGGAQAGAGNVSITGGSVFAYSGTGPNDYGEGAGIGAGVYSRSGDGRITITGGNVFANKIGLDNAGGATPTTLTGGVIIVGNINATDFGEAQVMTDVSLSLEMLQAMAEHSAAALNVTLEMHDTVHDTILWHTRDTIWVHIIIADTVRKDTIVYRLDTLHVAPEVHDTTLLPLEVIREVHDTAYVHDTVHQDVVRQIIVVVDETGARTAVRDTLTATPAGGDLYYIDGPSGFDPAAPLAIYTLTGNLLYSGAVQPVALPGVGVGPFVVAQAGHYYCLLR